MATGNKSAHSPITTETRLSFPLNGTIYTTTRDVAREKPAPVIGQTMEGELGPQWSNSYVVEANFVPGSDDKKLKITHIRVPTEAEQLPSNWEFSTCDIGGTKYPSVMRTFIKLAATVEHDAPAQGTAMPVEDGSIFAGKGYILVSRKVPRSQMTFEPVFRVEQCHYVIRVSLTSNGIDSWNGLSLTATKTLYTAEEFAALGITWGIQGDGTQYSYRQLSCSWYEVTHEDVFGGGVTSKSYNSTENYYWPAVLKEVEFMDWDRRDGGVDIRPRVVWEREAYRGPCAALIEQQWSVGPGAVSVPDIMLPTPMVYASPFFAVSVPACLHGEIGFKCDIGSSDPTYKPNAGSLRTFAATDPTTWPGAVVASHTQKPFRGGYMRTKVTILAPTP